MDQHTAICFGEALIDHHKEGSVVGGAPLHVAARLAAMGWNSDLLSRVGNDRAGRRILEAIKACQVRDRLVQVDDRALTGSAIIHDGLEGMNRFEITHPVAWDRIESPEELPAHDVFYFGSLVGRDEVSRRALFAAAGISDAKVKICDINLRYPWVNAQTVGWALGTATVLKCSEEELRELSDGGARKLLDEHPQLELIAVTAGAEGASLCRSESQTHLSAPEVEVVDTVGAGDAFTAGLIDGLVNRDDDSEILRRAVSSATRAVKSRGGLPTPTSP